MENYLSLEQAAKKIGANYSAFRQRKAIKKLAKSTNFITQGASHVRLYPVGEFPPELLGFTDRQDLSPSTISEPLIPISQLPTPISHLLDPNSKESCLARAKQDLLRIQAEWCECKGIASEAGCDRAFAAAVAAGSLHIPDEIASVICWGKSNGISRGSLRRMRAGICHRNLDRPKTKKIDEREDLRNYIISYIHDYAHANMSVLRRELVGRFADVPSLSTLTRWVDSWKKQNAATYLRATNPDKFRNKYMSAFGSQSQDVTQPNHRWELDSTPADILLVDGRYSVIALIDVYTRRANLLVSNRSKSEAIISLMRQTILKWGMPYSIKTDNGADYASNAMKNACNVLAIWQEFCPPYSPEKKPHVERFLGTFNHDWLPTLPGYAGHNVETRQAIRSQRSFADNRVKPDRSIEIRLTSEEFQNACTNWVVAYNDRVHGSLGMHSPNTCWNAAGFFPREPELRNLDLLLAFQGTRKVLKSGISFGGGMYIAGNLLPGDEVKISIDAADMGRIYVFDMLGNFICQAWDNSLKGIDRQKIAEDAERLQKAAVAVARQDLKSAKSVSNFGKIQKEVVAQRVSGKVVDLPVSVSSAPLTDQHQSEKVVSIKKRTATPEELFDRAWHLFSNDLAVDLTTEDCNRVWFGISKGDCEAILNSRTDREGGKAFLSWLRKFSPAAQKEA
jgi:transposase InsO family protein